MLKQNIKELALREGLTTAYQFWKASGFNQQTAYRLWNDEEAIPRQAVMLRLFEVFGWQPGAYLYAVHLEMTETAA